VAKAEVVVEGQRADVRALMDGGGWSAWPMRQTDGAWYFAFALLEGGDAEDGIAMSQHWRRAAEEAIEVIGSPGVGIRESKATLMRALEEDD
jgi:hypothetical protein